MKLKRFKERDRKRTGIIVFTIISCILLVSGVILYRTFAIFEVKTNQNVIKGTVQDPGNIYFAFYQKNEESGEYVIQKDMPDLRNGYVLDEVKSYCGVNGENDKNIQVYLSEDGYIKVKGMTTSRTKCNLYFAKGIFIKEKGIPVVTSGAGLYEVTHSAEETLGMDTGWQEKEYRYAGKNPNNYVSFNDEPWRIIGLVNVKVTNEDESEEIEQRLKIIRSDYIGVYPYDKDSSNDWTNSSLMTMSNGIYYSASNGECWQGSWSNGEVNLSKATCTFDGDDKKTNNSKGLNSEAQNMIDENIIWNLGGSDNNLTVEKFYKNERGSTVWHDRPKEWKKDDTNSETFHSIALAYVSDYAYATSGGKIGRDKCFKDVLNLWDFECSNYDWIWALNKEIRLLTPSSINSYNIFSIRSEGVVGDFVGSYPREIYPVVYLLPNVTISSGTGTADDIFILSIK